MTAPTPGYSAKFIRRFAALFWPFARIWFRPRVEGLEQVPPAPCLFICNHSAYGVFEILVLLALWNRRFGVARPVVGMAHDLGLIRPIRWGVIPIGGVRASHQAALEALRRGYDVLAFPGGFVDALRPFGARYEVHWGRRAGFVRVAAEAGAPVVPLVNCGSHAQYSGAGSFFGMVDPGGRGQRIHPQPHANGREIPQGGGCSNAVGGELG